MNFIFFWDVSASVQPTSNQPQPPGANVNNNNAFRPDPSAPPPDPAFYVPPPGGGYHPHYPPSSSNNQPYPPCNTNQHYPASTSQRHPLNSGQNPSSTQNAGNDAQNDNDTCIVCLDHRVEILLRPCNHFNLCEECSKSLNQCPTCRGAIQDKIKPYRQHTCILYTYVAAQCVIYYPWSITRTCICKRLCFRHGFRVFFSEKFLGPIEDFGSCGITQFRLPYNGS